jgi:hypothetical protein
MIAFCKVPVKFPRLAFCSQHLHFDLACFDVSTIVFVHYGRRSLKHLNFWTGILSTCSNLWRTTSEEKRAQERLEKPMYNAVRQAAVVHRQVILRFHFVHYVVA